MAKLTIVPQSKGPIDWSKVNLQMRLNYERNQKLLSGRKESKKQVREEVGEPTNKS